MSELVCHNAAPPKMSRSTFSKFSLFIQEELGIKMPGMKLVMLQSRLSKRLKKTNCSSFDKYYEYVFSPEGRKNELFNMIDVVTTNKTDFFREANHFNYLTTKALPELTALKKKVGLWSAGCSTGEEPYTLAMVLKDYSDSKTPKLNFSILATDISCRVLDKAMLGEYTTDQIEPVPLALRKKYMLRGQKNKEGYVKIKSFLKSYIKFKRLNLLDANYGFKTCMDIIFCRNVIIYFDKSTQKQVITQFCRSLNHEGYLFLGHSETLNDHELPLHQVAPTVYKKY